VSRTALAAFVVLVAATFAAFFVAQRLKGAPPVVELHHARSPFSPNGDHRLDVKHFTVEVRHPDKLTVDVVDESGGVVRRLADGRSAHPGVPIPLHWDGRDDDGTIVPDGRYLVRVTLSRTGRTVTAPHPLRVDTRPPRPYVKSVAPDRIVAPGTRTTFTLGHLGRTRPTDVTLLRTDTPHPQVVAKGVVAGGEDSWTWDGRMHGAPAPAGTYLLQVERSDQAGNVARVPAQVPTRAPIPGAPGITVRALGAQPPVGPVTAGERVSVNVDSRRRPYTWRLERVGEPGSVAHGRATSTPLRFRAPDGRSGLYVLRLRAGRAGTRVPILVQSARRAKLLVVVPAITWEGSAAVDDGTDGQPDTLASGGPVPWPRVLPELPADFRTQVAPLLIFLDRSHVRYDLTSDLALALGTGPRATDRPAVLLAGSETWIPAAYGRRLRRYVLEGGRLATIGTDSLRRGVTLLSRAGGTSGQLARPTAEVDSDPFGARLSRDELSAGTTLEPIAGDAQAPLLSFWDGTLTGFGAAEVSDPPASTEPATVKAGIGVAPTASEQPRPAITQDTLGKGTVIRIGLPGWARRTTTDADVAQLTRNAVDVLIGAQPAPHDLGELAAPQPEKVKKPRRGRRSKRG
jgi:flagellar hook assembly protein FlgD